MQDNFFDETGWGIFMDENEPSLHLYPGAMKAASANPEIKNRNLDVFIPGHCEPPPGGTDIDTLNGEYKSINTANEDRIKVGFPVSNADGSHDADYAFQNAWISKNEWQDLWDNNDTVPNFDKDGYIDLEYISMGTIIYC